MDIEFISSDIKPELNKGYFVNYPDYLVKLKNDGGLFGGEIRQMMIDNQDGEYYCYFDLLESYSFDWSRVESWAYLPCKQKQE